MFNHKELKTYSSVLLVSPLALPIPKNFMPLLCFFSNHSCHHIFPRISVTYLHRFLSRGSSRLSAHKAVLPWQVQWISDWRSCQSAWTCLKCKYGDCIFEWKKKKAHWIFVLFAIFASWGKFLPSFITWYSLSIIGFDCFDRGWKSSQYHRWHGES